MIINLDRWFAEEQENTAEGRVFPHDVFISHRRYDLPASLVESLTALRANVIWDCNLDLRDRRVARSIAHATRRSRFVALYVSNLYVDTPWCCAEYSNALWIEEHYNVSRTFVICESENALLRVPEALRKAPRFILAPGVYETIADFVVFRNSYDNEEAVSLRRVPEHRLCPDTNLLSLDEQLNLLEQRISFWKEFGTGEIKHSEKEQTAGHLASILSAPITEVEIILREVRKILFDGLNNETPVSLSRRELARVVNMGKIVANAYADPKRFAELKGLDEWAYDFILKPLLLAVELEETRLDASNVYRALCAALTSGENGHEVPVYMDVLEAVESQREDPPSAVKSHRMALYEAHEAASRYRR